MRVYKIPQGKSAINDAQIHVFDMPFISLSIIFLNRLGDPSHMRYHVFMKEFLTAFQHEFLLQIQTSVYASELGRKLREKGETFRDITQSVLSTPWQFVVATDTHIYACTRTTGRKIHVSVSINPEVLKPEDIPIGFEVGERISSLKSVVLAHSFVYEQERYPVATCCNRHTFQQSSHILF